MNTPSTDVTRPSWSSGVTSGTSDPRMYIETMSAPESTTSDERHRVAAGDTEHDRAEAEHRDHRDQRRPDVAADRPHGEHDRHQTGTDPGAAEPAVRDVTDAETVLGHRRDQGHRATEQHREQIERDRGQHDRRATDEVQPFECQPQRRPVANRHRRPLILDQQYRHRRHDEHDAGDDVRQRLVDAVEEAASAGPMIIAAVNVPVHIPTTRGSSPAGDTNGGIERCAE